MTDSAATISKMIADEEAALTVERIVRIQHRFVRWKLCRGSDWKADVVRFPNGDGPGMYTLLAALPFLPWETNTSMAIAEAKEFIVYNNTMREVAGKTGSDIWD